MNVTTAFAAFKSWYGQATTGAGIAAILGTVAAMANGQLTPHQAIPLLVAGVIGLVWPENKVLQSAAATVATSVMDARATYLAGFDHGVKTATAAVAVLPVTDSQQAMVNRLAVAPVAPVVPANPA